MTPNSSAGSATRLGENHGYRFDGDFVHLNAELNFSDADLAAGLDWCLQLWASPVGFAEGELHGVKVAELPVQAMAGGVVVAACCSAMPPAGAEPQVLALALVAGGADGRPQVRDLAVYAVPASFCQPRLGGEVACTLADGTAELKIESIVNPRAPDNLSGTLSLEVWALAVPYAGGSWSGAPVASLVLGVLAGGSAWAASQFTVPAAPPAAGAALTVMLREWTPAGYVTRDYRNFPAARPAEAAPPAEKADMAKPVAQAGLPAAAVTAPESGSTAAGAEPEGAAAPRKAARKAGGKKAASQATGKAVSVNEASEAALLAVKGLPPAVARAIIAARPFARLEEVCRAKGMGPKMLARLRDQLVL